MADKIANLDGTSRVPLSVLYAFVIATAGLVALATTTLHSINQQLSDIRAGGITGIVTSQAQENWVLRARAENAVKFPSLVWPDPTDSSNNRPLSVASSP